MTIRDELQALFDQMTSAYRAGDAAACAAMWTGDGALYSPFAPPTHGRAAIEALHRDWTDDGAGKGKTLKVLDAGADGNLAWCVVAFAEGEMTESGTSLSILQRQADGTWLIRVCSLNSDEVS
jgi:uncharacterized protein (TIGR02246 family)